MSEWLTQLVVGVDPVKTRVVRLLSQPDHKFCCVTFVNVSVPTKNQDLFYLLPTLFTRVSDLDPDWIRIQSGQWIRIQEGKNDPQK
jgi:hypothetical protein